MKDGQITVNDGRRVAFADYGTSDQTAVVWCHGGPGSRLEPEICATAAGQAGLRLIGIDRPGYGRSTPRPGRTIDGWIPDALAVVDHLGIDRFVSVGASTGGAYALALASASRRVMGAVACCAVSDMRWVEGRALIPGALAVWEAPNREAAHAIVVAQFGERGENMSTYSTGDAAAEADREMLADPAAARYWQRTMSEAFVPGFGGYVDDRLADGSGWDTFDVSAITCPVVVLHGSGDTLVPVAHAHHTAALVPGATLRIVDRLGHLSIVFEMVSAIRQVLARVNAPSPAFAP
jgi:pimeloyl-ACP methyl ester carboxylesterase